MFQNSEKCSSRAQNDIFEFLLYLKAQRLLIYCHKLHIKSANPNIQEAETSKCLIIFLDTNHLSID